MTKPEIRRKLSSIVTRLAPLTPENAAINPLAFTAESDAVPMDSVVVLRLVLAIEEEFGITVEDGDIGPENFGNLGGLCAFVEAKLAAS
jgi:acyl carrier protein